MGDTKDSVGLFIRNAAGLYLLQFRDNAPQNTAKLTWDVFGGHMKLGETPEKCASRELPEELAIGSVHIASFSIVGYFEKENGGLMYCAQYQLPIEWKDFRVLEGAGAGFFSTYDVSCLQPVFSGAREMFRRFGK